METRIKDVYGDELVIKSGRELPCYDAVILKIDCDAEPVAALDAAGVEALIADLTKRLAKMRGEAAP